MNILVTGSEGTLGRPLVKELRSRGHNVWGCDRAHTADIQVHRADVANYRQLAEVFEMAEPTVVYHLAAEFGRHNGEQFYEDLWRTGMVGTRNVLELCKTYGARLMFASSSEVYGEADKQTLHEDLDQKPLWPANDYAMSKWAGEQQIMNFQQKTGLEAYRFRFFNAYGPGERFTPYRSVVALFCHKALAGEVLPVYENYHRTFMYIDDFIPTLANACEAEMAWLVYNIGGADYRSVADLAALIIEQVGDGSIMRIAEDKHNTRNKRPDIKRACADLGHNPVTPLESGIPKTLKWMGLIEEKESYGNLQRDSTQ